MFCSSYGWCPSDLGMTCYIRDCLRVFAGQNLGFHGCGGLKNAERYEYSITTESTVKLPLRACAPRSKCAGGTWLFTVGKLK